MDWDDLRYILAVAEGGSLAAAGRLLGVNHTTVLRRINSFERSAGLRLFERLPGGYAVTAGGEELLSAARHVRETVTALERKIAGKDLRLSGVLRVTSTDTLMASLLPSLFADFRAEHPGIVLEVSFSNIVANLSKRDADVAIRPMLDVPVTLIGRRVSTVAFAVYAARTLRATEIRTADLGAYPWIAPDATLAETSVARWMRAELGDADVVLLADSLLAMRDAARAGLGLAVLPSYLGDLTPDLTRVHPPIEEMATALWVLTHPDLRRTARVRVFTAFAAEVFHRQRALLEGRGAGLALRRPSGY